MAYPIIGQPKPQFMDSSGDPYASGTLEIQDPANSGAKSYYPTAADADANTNGATAVITLDASGKTPTELWGRDGEDYKYVLSDELAVVVDTVDNIRLPGPSRRPTLTFTAADTTPSVADGQLFNTVDGTVITDFDDGETGDIIVVKGNSANPTLVHNGARLIMRDAQDFVMNGSDTITFALIQGGVWYEVARSRNSSDSINVVEDLVITDVFNGSTYFIADSLGIEITLPAPVNGYKFTFYVSVQPTSGDHTIVTDSGDNIMYGSIINNGAGAPGSAEDVITFVSSTAEVGDKVELESDGTYWFFTAISSITGGITASAT